MYLRLAAANPGPVLELAAGSGRIVSPLAAAGHDVTGVDRDADMLGRARQAWARLESERKSWPAARSTWSSRTILELNLGRRFGLVILALNSLLLLGGDDAKQRALQGNSRAPDGKGPRRHRRLAAHGRGSRALRRPDDARLDPRRFAKLASVSPNVVGDLGWKPTQGDGDERLPDRSRHPMDQER